MNEELKAALLAALLSAGLSKDLLPIINIENEGEIQGVIDNLKSISTPIPLTEEELSKNVLVQKIADRRVTEALKKVKKPDNDPPTPPTGLTAESIAKIIEEAQKPLKDQLETLTGQRSLESKQSNASRLIQASKLSDFEKKKALGRLNFDSEMSIEDQISGLETEESDRLQYLADNGRLAAAPPAIGGAGEMTEAEAQAIADRQK